jgi:hypothetical protein
MMYVGEISFSLAEWTANGQILIMWAAGMIFLHKFQYMVA